MRLTLAFLTIAGATFGQSLLLDDFTSGPYTPPPFNAGAPPDSSFKPLPAGGPAGPARYTYFTVSALPDYHQTSTLYISNGFLITALEAARAFLPDSGHPHRRWRARLVLHGGGLRHCRLAARSGTGQLRQTPFPRARPADSSSQE